jgi:hypothetical protein
MNQMARVPTFQRRPVWLGEVLPVHHETLGSSDCYSRSEIFSATLDFIRFKPILINMARVGVPAGWITMLGILKAAGAVGLLVGIEVPLIGTAAAIGLVLFFVGAIATHLRAGDYSFGLAVMFLLLALVALVSKLAVS